MCVAVSMTFSLVSLWNDPTPFETELKYATNLKVSRTIQGNFSCVSHCLNGYFIMQLHLSPTVGHVSGEFIRG